MIVHAIKETGTSNIQFIVQLLEAQIQELTHDAIVETSRAVGREIAAHVFAEHKERIIAAVDIDLVVAEIQKTLLDKIKAHGADEAAGEEVETIE